MSGLGTTWERFWFTPTSTSTLAVVRVAYGLVLLGWATSLAPDAVDFYSSVGLLAERPSGDWTWSLLDVSSSPWAVIGQLAAMMAAAACLVLGFHTRLASVVAFVALLSFQRRNPFVDNGGDLLLRVLGFSLLLAPAGAALSLDRWRTRASSWWECPPRAPWALRLMQVQMSVVYLFGVWEKVQGTTWNDGTAISYAWRVEELTRFTLPGWLTDSLVVVNALTYGTLALEAALAVLVWNRRARPWVLAGGVALHAAIDVTMVVGFFSLVVLVGYVTFVPSEAMDRALVTVRHRLTGFLGENRKGAGLRLLPPLTSTPRTQGGSTMNSIATTHQLDVRSGSHRSAGRFLSIATLAAILALAALALGSAPASAVPGGPSGPGGDLTIDAGDPTDDPTGDPTFDPTTADLTSDGGDPTDDPTFDPTTADLTSDGGDPTDDPTDDPTFDPTTADVTSDGGDPTDGDGTDGSDDGETDGSDDGEGTDGGTDGSDSSDGSDGGTDGSSDDSGTDGSDSSDGSGDGGGDGGGRRIVVPTRIDTGAGGSSTGPGGLALAAVVAGALALVGVAARRSIVGARSSGSR